MNRYFRARISENKLLTQSYNLITLSPIGDVIKPKPGQFYMLGLGRDSYDPLLKRPFSMFRTMSSGIQILYRIKGRGTNMLREVGSGAEIDMLGPLGNSYPMPGDDAIPLIIAGGIGIASVFSLAERLSKKAYIFYGARTQSELLFLDELNRVARELFISTDDGSAGMKGTVINVLNDFLTRHSSLVTRHSIYACGPTPLFKSLSEFLKDKDIKTYVSLEERMACGVGACLGCATKTVSGHKSVCKDGPVFDIREIVW